MNKMRMMAKKTAAVIGVGAIGLSTAVLALERGYHVTIYSDKPLVETTSMKAAASFKPPLVAYNELTHRMLELAWQSFERIALQDTEAAGVRKHIHWEAMSALREPAMYLSVMEAVEVLERPYVPGQEGMRLDGNIAPFLLTHRSFFPGSCGGLLQVVGFSCCLTSRLRVSSNWQRCQRMSYSTVPA